MPYGEVVLATFFWAMSAPYVRWIGFPPTYLTFIRCIVPLAIAGVWVIRTAHWRRLVTRSSRAGIWNRYTLFASLCNLVRSLLYFWGFILLPAGHAILLIYTWPIMVAALSSVVLDEPFHPFQLAMGLIALAGMAVIQFDPSTLATPNIWLGSVVVLGVAAANAGMLLAFKRNPHPLTPLETIVIQNSSGALFFLPVGLTMAPIFPWTRTAVSVVMAIVVGIGGYIFFYSALKKLPTTNAAVLSYLEVIFTIIIAAIFMSEPITMATVIGGSLILAGSIGAQLFQRAPSRS